MKSATRCADRQVLLLFLIAVITGSVPASALELEMTPARWELLKYASVPAHRLTFARNKLKLAVRRSASPVIYPIDKPIYARRLYVKAFIDGEINFGSRRQGEKRADDFRLRVGVIYAGDRVLDSIQLSMAPGWIQRLYALAPVEGGISRVEFFSTWSDPRLANRRRQHPTTNLWHENYVLEISNLGVIEQSIAIPNDEQILGVWLSSDGDDTGACFSVTVERIELSG